MTRVTRREFGTNTAVPSLASRLPWCSPRVRGANDRVRLGFIGLGNRGDQVLDAFLEHKDAEVVALCDIYQPYLDFAATEDRRRARAAQRLSQAARAARTSTRWSSPRRTTGTRCRPSTPARRARTSTSKSRCRSSSPKAARWSRRPAGTTASRRSGIHRRSSPFVEEAAELIRGGAIGKVTVARAFHIQNEWPKGIGNPPDERAAGRPRLGRLARARRRSGLQQEPHLLPVPLVLRLLRRPAHQLRRALPRRHPLGPRPGRAEGGRRPWAASSPSTTTAKSPTRSR